MSNIQDFSVITQLGVCAFHFQLFFFSWNYRNIGFTLNKHSHCSLKYVFVSKVSTALPNVNFHQNPKQGLVQGINFLIVVKPALRNGNNIIYVSELQCQILDPSESSILNSDFVSVVQSAMSLCFICDNIYIGYIFLVILHTNYTSSGEHQQYMGMLNPENSEAKQRK